MNKYDELIIKYFDGQLSEDERKNFENELEINAELKTALEEYRNVNELFSTKDELPLAQDYFTGIVPRFRQTLDKKITISPLQKMGFAFATILLAVSSYLLVENYLLNQRVPDYSIESITGNLSKDDMDELASYISDDYWNIIPSEEKLKLLNETDINMDDVVAELSLEEGLIVLSEYQINDLYSQADEEQLETAYNELLNKRIY